MRGFEITRRLRAHKPYGSSRGSEVDPPGRCGRLLGDDPPLRHRAARGALDPRGCPRGAGRAHRVRACAQGRWACRPVAGVEAKGEALSGVRPAAPAPQRALPRVRPARLDGGSQSGQSWLAETPRAWAMATTVVKGGLRPPRS